MPERDKTYELVAIRGEFLTRALYISIFPKVFVHG